MNPRQILRTGLTASALAHLSALLLLLFFTEVHPFGSVTAEPIAVDIVPSTEVPPPAKQEEPLPDLSLPDPKSKPSDVFELPSKSASRSSPAPAPAAPKAAAARPQQQGAQQPPPQPAPSQPAPQQPAQQQAALSTPSPGTPPAPLAQPASAPPPPPPPPSPATSSTPAYAPPQPDLSIKYHVMLGLPPNLPAGLPEDKSDDTGVAEASQKADVVSSVIAEFRRHIKTCSKLPASITPSDKVRIKLQVLMTPEGKLAAKPVAIEGPASQKGVDLTESAIDALVACQPYLMLPADRYTEWKVLNLSFTPQDF